jgi:hypothetical protein
MHQADTIMLSSDMFEKHWTKVLIPPISFWTNRNLVSTQKSNTPDTAAHLGDRAEINPYMLTLRLSVKGPDQISS